MKKIIKPKQEEKIEYFSDFSGQSFKAFGPDVQIQFEFNYGSEFDGSRIEFHLTDQEAKHVLDFIRMNLSKASVKELKTKLKAAKENFNDNINARDWQSCEYFRNAMNLYKYFLPNDDN